MSLKDLTAPRGTITRRRFLSTAAAAGGSIALAPSLASCGSDSGGGSSNLSFVTGENNPETIEIFEKFFSDFESKHQGVTVNAEFLSGDQAQQRMTQLVGSGDPPDMVKLDTNDVAPLALEGVLEPVTDVVAEMGTVPDSSRLVIDGEDYMVPTELGMWMLFYRKDILEPAGIAPPKTWADFGDAMQALSNSAVHPNLFVTNTSSSYTASVALNYCWSNEALFWSWVDGQWRVVLDEEPNLQRAVEALEFFKTRVEFSPPSGNYDWADVNQTYASGQIAMIEYGGARTLVNLKRNTPEIAEKTGVATLPRADRLACVGNAGGFAIFKKSDEQTALVKELASSILSSANFLDYLWTVPGHFLPPTREQLEGEWRSHPFLEGNPDLLEVIDETYDKTYYPMKGGPAPDGEAEVNIAAGAIINTEIYGEMVVNAATGTQTPEEAVKSAAEQMREFQSTQG